MTQVLYYCDFTKEMPLLHQRPLLPFQAIILNFFVPSIYGFTGSFARWFSLANLYVCFFSL